MFFRGVRPAINVGLSVSRVGSAAQTCVLLFRHAQNVTDKRSDYRKIMKKFAGSLKLYLAQYREVAAFAQFGSDLDAATKQTLNRGERLTELLKQVQYAPMAVNEMVPLIYAGVNGLLDGVPVAKIGQWEKDYLSELKSNQSELMQQIDSQGQLSKDLEQQLKESIQNFNRSFS